MRDTLPHLINSSFPEIQRKTFSTLQANIILTCNQSCFHCHVNSSPKRKEAMSDETIEQLLSLLDVYSIKVLDITGGAPELHSSFQYLVEQAKKKEVHVIDRCNLTILLEEGQEDTAEFLAQNQVEVVASLPCYLEDNVDKQRGDGVFIKSIEALKKLNQLGYGKQGENLKLSLVYNPQGAVLPPSQMNLEKDYRKILKEQYDIEFTRLFALCNMPIKRFGSTLLSNNQFDDYLKLLKDSYSVENLKNLMCREMLSIDYQGYVFDCDFNQMLALNKPGENGNLHVSELLEKQVDMDEIIVCEHCYGCTAGQGSSCGGALN